VSLARHLGMFVDRHGHLGLEERIKMMTPEEWLARVAELLERGLQYLSPEQLEQFKAIEAEYEDVDTEPPQQKRRSLRGPHR
jgi:hypothetical protein